MTGSAIPAARGANIVALALPVGGNEIQQDLQADATGPTIKKILIQSRDNTKALLVRFKNSGDYFTIHAGQTYWDDGLDCFTLSVFITGAVNDQVAEILYWN